MKNIFLSALFLAGFGVAALAQESATTLDFRLKGLKKGDRIYLLSREENRTDTLTATRNNRIVTALPVSRTKECILYYLPDGRRQADLLNSEARCLCLQPGDRLSVKGDLGRLGQTNISGGIYSQYPYRQYLDSLDGIRDRVSVYTDSMKVLERSAAAMPEGAEREAQIQEILRLNKLAGEIVQDSYRLMENFVRRYPDDPFSAYVLTGIKGSKNISVIEELFGLLGEKARSTPAGEEMELRLSIQHAWEQANAQIKTGKPAPDFTLTGIDGQPVSLSDFRGRYLVLDFWGSWCGPCRNANPHMVALYERYRERPDFAMLSLALDRDDAAWRKAVEDDRLTWPQVNMCETPDSPASVNVLYGVSLYPTQMLVSPEGEILVRQNGFDPQNNLVAKRLEQIFGM